MLQYLSNSVDTALFLVATSAEEVVLAAEGELSRGPAGVRSSSALSGSRDGSAGCDGREDSFTRSGHAIQPARFSCDIPALKKGWGGGWLCRICQHQLSVFWQSCVRGLQATALQKLFTPAHHHLDRLQSESN